MTKACMHPESLACSEQGRLSCSLRMIICPVHFPSARSMCICNRDTRRPSVCWSLTVHGDQQGALDTIASGDLDEDDGAPPGSVPDAGAGRGGLRGLMVRTAGYMRPPGEPRGVQPFSHTYPSKYSDS